MLQTSICLKLSKSAGPSDPSAYASLDKMATISYEEDKSSRELSLFQGATWSYGGWSATPKVSWSLEGSSLLEEPSQARRGPEDEPRFVC